MKRQPECNAEMFQLRSEGWSYVELAERFGASTRCVFQILDEPYPYVVELLRMKRAIRNMVLGE